MINYSQWSSSTAFNTGQYRKRRIISPDVMQKTGKELGNTKPNIHMPDNLTSAAYTGRVAKDYDFRTTQGLKSGYSTPVAQLSKVQGQYRCDAGIHEECRDTLCGSSGVLMLPSNHGMCASGRRSRVALLPDMGTPQPVARLNQGRRSCLRLSISVRLTLSLSFGILLRIRHRPVLAVHVGQIALLGLILLHLRRLDTASRLYNLSAIHPTLV